MTDINLLDRYPTSKRPIDERGKMITAEHRRMARKFGKEFFDGDRLTGYGGYNYDPRFWTDTAIRFRDHYNLPENARILDVGCAKGFMLYDFLRQMPMAQVFGLDISHYAVSNAHSAVRRRLCTGDARRLPFPDNSFDLVISINTIHNLALEECKAALREIERVSASHAFVTMDAWRTKAEQENMLKWNLTALTYMHVDEWHNLFDDVGYTGDSWWFIAE